jgi:hypothetical protein
MLKHFFNETHNSYLKHEDLLSYLHRVDNTNSNGQSIFHLASQHGHIEIMKHLLECNIDLNQVDAKNNTPLHLLVMNKKTSALQFLFEYLAKNKKLNKLNFNMLNSEGQTSLHVAALKGIEQAITILCDYGCNVDILDQNKLTALEAIVSSDCCILNDQIKTKTIQALVKCGARYNGIVNKVDSYIKDMRMDKKEIKNLVFEGGGVKGIAYIGALKRCLEIENFFKFDDIVNIGGTSAGAMHVTISIYSC